MKATEKKLESTEESQKEANGKFFPASVHVLQPLCLLAFLYGSHPLQPADCGLIALSAG